MSLWGENGRAGAGEVGRADLTRQQEAFVSIQGAMVGRATQGFQAELHHERTCCEQVPEQGRAGFVGQRRSTPAGAEGTRAVPACALYPRGQGKPASAPTLTLGESIEISCTAPQKNTNHTPSFVSTFREMEGESVTNL